MNCETIKECEKLLLTMGFKKHSSVGELCFRKSQKIEKSRGQTLTTEVTLNNADVNVMIYLSEEPPFKGLFIIGSVRKAITELTDLMETLGLLRKKVSEKMTSIAIMLGEEAMTGV